MEHIEVEMRYLTEMAKRQPELVIDRTHHRPAGKLKVALVCFALCAIVASIASVF